MAGTNLGFDTPRVEGNADLAFGASGGTGQSITVTGNIVMPMFSVVAQATYDSNVWRGTAQTAALPYTRPRSTGLQLKAPWADRPKVVSEAVVFWDQPLQIQVETRSLLGSLQRIRSEAALPYNDALKIELESFVPWFYLLRMRGEAALPWDEGAAKHNETPWRWRNPPRAQVTDSLAWDKSHRWFIDPKLPYDPKPTRRRMDVVLPWEQGANLISLWPRPDVYVPPVIPPRIITADLNLNCPVDGTLNLRFGWLCGGDGGQIIIPIKRAYIVIHDIEVLRLPDNISIPASKITISYDADAWSWGWSATLFGKAALDAVLPSAQGEPVTLSVNINGHVWHLVVEEWSESREFGKRGVSVKGRGLSSFLASPYLLPTSGMTTAARTMQQLMGDHLPIDSGASITWATGMADWLVPAGAWSWSNQSPINAIHAAAQEVGMVVVPGMANKVLHIQPRYPIMPWDYATATPGLIVPDTAILSANRRQAVPTQANAVYVHGGEVGGVLAQVKRIYSAGDRVAPTASSNLITHADAARHLGSRLLAAQHQQPALRDITLPLGGVFGLGTVGQLIVATIDSTEHRGIINSVAIDASMSDKSVSVRQTLTIGEDTPNTWSRFKRLLPYDPLLVGTIEQVYPDGTTTVLMLGGGIQRVRGTGTAGQKVYVRGGMIEGQAPNMAQVEIDV